MQDTLKLGRLVGVKVGANWSLFALAAVVAYFLATSRLPAGCSGYMHSSYWLAGILTAVALLAGVLVHEAAHAVAAQRAGLHVDGITLWFMGGVTRIEGDNRKPSTELVVALVGPWPAASSGLSPSFWPGRPKMPAGASPPLPYAGSALSTCCSACSTCCRRPPWTVAGYCTG